VDEKYIWPLVGVVLGWLLTQLASGMKDRAEDRRKVGRLLSSLLLIQDQLATLIDVCDRIKTHVDGWEAYERMRKGISDRHFLEPSTHLDSIRKAIDDVSGLYPMEAHSLQRLIDLLLKNKKASLAASSLNRDLYVRGISAYEVGLDLAAAELKLVTRRFGHRHGFFTYAKVLFREVRSKRRRTKTDAFLAAFSKDAFAELNSAAETPKPSVEARPNGGVPPDLER